MFTVEYFAEANGTVVLDKWLDGLADGEAVARIVTRIERLKRGSFGDYKRRK
jgi:putative component of toxin-antitoxin plasmid stabilization module